MIRGSRGCGGTLFSGLNTRDGNTIPAPGWPLHSGAQSYDEFRKAQANLRANIVAGKGNTFAYTGAAGTSPLPIFMAFLQGIPLNDSRNQAAANYTATQFGTSSWYNSLNMYAPSLTGISGTGTTGLQNDAFLANAAKAGLPLNFFQANPAVKNGGAYLETTAGNTRFNALQIDLRRRMSQGLVVQGAYQFSFGRKGWSQRSLREDWFYVDSTGGPTHSLKVNWAYELPFGQGKRFGGGASRWTERLIGGWEVDGVGRVQTGAIFNFGAYRLVGMTEQEFQDMFQIYHVPDSAGVDRIYTLPQDVILNSILAIYTSSATTASGYAGALPTGRYLAPASGLDCVQYLAAQCPGTMNERKVTGPKYWKLDMSFVKRIAVVKNARIEARMDLFNIFDTINFNALAPTAVTGTNATTGMGSAVSNWQVTSAATDTSASQDPGGRISQFGLRIIW